jgi:hypothetical protein
VTHKRFPPGIGHVLVPTSSTREALAGLSLYTPSRRRGLAAHAAAEWMVRRFGTAWLPGRATDVPPITRAEGWDEIEELLRHELGVFNAVAVHTRRLPHRPGAALLLLRDGNPVAFVKIGPDPSIEHEHHILLLLDRTGEPLGFEAPVPLGLYSVGQNRVAMMTVACHGRHRPLKRPPLTGVFNDVQRALRHLPRPPDVPPHWVPMHGDLSPWNLRVDSTGRTVLFDWEEAGFGPPGADRVYYAVSSAAVGLPWRLSDEPAAEAVRFWRARFGERHPSRLRKAMVRQLSRLERS